MKKRFLLIALTVLVFFILTACGNLEPHDSTQKDASIGSSSVSMGEIMIFRHIEHVFEFLMVFYEEDFAESVHVVRAEMLDERMEHVDISNTGTHEHLPVSRARILDTFLGDTQLGGVIEVVGYNTHSTQPLAGKDLILFLTYHPEQASGYHVVITAFQGIYHTPPQLAYPQSIISSILTRTISEDMILEPLSPHNNLVLTVQDLARIAGLCDSPWPQPPTRQPEMYPYLVPHTDGFIEVEIRP